MIDTTNTKKETTQKTTAGTGYMDKTRMADPQGLSTFLNRNKKVDDRFWLKTVPFFVVIIFLLVIIGVATGLHSDSWLYRFARPIATYTHFPIAMVGTNFISYPDYVNELSIVQRIPSSSQIGDVFSSNDFTSIALTKSIRENILTDAYNAYAISVSEEDLADEFKRIYGYDYTSVYASDLVQNTIGMSPDEFVHGLLREYILKQKLTSALANDQDYMNPRRESIRTVARDVKDNPELFDEFISGSHQVPFVQTQSSSFYRTSELSGSFSILKNLKAGEVSDIIDNKSRLSVFRLIQQISEGNTTYLELQELYVLYVDANQYVQQQLSDQHVRIFLSGYHWESGCQSVVKNGYTCGTMPENAEEAFWVAP